jgi:hypothetical protein
VWLGRVEFDVLDERIVEDLVVVEAVERSVDDGQVTSSPS